MRRFRKLAARALVLAAALILSPCGMLRAEESPADCLAEPEIAASSRLVLIIANDAYSGGWKALTSPPDDRLALSRAFARAGFAVTSSCNADTDGLRRTLARFADATRGAEVAVIYFAGHGFVAQDTAWLVPVGSPGTVTGDDPARDFVSALELRAAMSGAGKALLFLDACRSILDRRSGSARGTIANASAFDVEDGAVAFAAAYGQPAFDSAPPGYDLSPFAQSLSEFLPVRGLEIGDLFHAVHADVERRTRVFEDGPQEPWLLDRIAEDFYFSPPLSLDVDSSGRGAAGRTAAPLGISLQELENGQEFAVATQLLKERGIAPVVESAEAGDPMAQYMLSYMLAGGIGIAEDQEAAQRYLRLSASAGNPAALTRLGFETVYSAESAEEDAAGQAMLAAAAEQDFGRAFYFLEDYARSAADGDAYSAFLLAAEGKTDQAFALLTGMAETGDDAAESWLCELAMIHHRRADAETACRNAANAGFPSAQAHSAVLARTDLAAREHWSVLGRPTVYFRLDRAEATGLNTQIVLDQLVSQLAQRPWRHIFIEGHTDDWRSREYSLGLATRLADSVRRQLQERGIDPLAMSTISFGKERPAINIDGFQPFNRRVEIRVEWLD